MKTLMATSVFLDDSAVEIIPLVFVQNFLVLLTIDVGFEIFKTLIYFALESFCFVMYDIS